MSREVTVVEVKEVLRVWRAGLPTKRVAAQLGLAPRTVRRFVAAATAAGVRVDAGAVTDDEVRDTLLALQPLGGRPRGGGWAQCTAHRPTIERWLRLRRETGGLAPKPVPGPPAVKTGALMEALLGRLAEHADATLEEQCSWWQGVSGTEVSTATMSRALTRLGWTRKKTRTAILTWVVRIRPGRSMHRAHYAPSCAFHDPSDEPFAAGYGSIKRSLPS